MFIVRNVGSIKLLFLTQIFLAVYMCTPQPDFVLLSGGDITPTITALLQLYTPAITA